MLFFQNVDKGTAHTLEVPIPFTKFERFRCSPSRIRPL